MVETYESALARVEHAEVADVAVLPTLFGTRPPHSQEGSGGNDSIASATTIPPPGGWTGATPLVAHGDIATTWDVDVFAVRPPSNYQGGMTFRLQSSGISLLASHLSVLDPRGHARADSQAESDLGDVVTLLLGQSVPNASYNLKVQGSTGDVYGIGSYGVAVTFDSAQTVLRRPSTRRSGVLTSRPGPTTTTPRSWGRGIHSSNNTHGADDLPGTATTLAPSPGYARNSHDELVGSLFDADLATGRIEHLLNVSFFIKDFGQDASGEFYVLDSTTLGPSGSNGVVKQITTPRSPAENDPITARDPPGRRDVAERDWGQRIGRAGRWP